MRQPNNYGVPRDVFSKFKWYFLYVPDLIILVLTGFFLMLMNKLFPPSLVVMMLLFDVTSIGLAIFLICHTNGGKRNYHLIVLYLKKRWRHYQKHYRAL